MFDPQKPAFEQTESLDRVFRGVEEFEFAAQELRKLTGIEKHYRDSGTGFFRLSEQERLPDFARPSAEGRGAREQQDQDVGGKASFRGCEQVSARFDGGL